MTLLNIRPKTGLSCFLKYSLSEILCFLFTSKVVLC